MSSQLTDETRAVLLLTSPLIAGGRADTKRLGVREFTQVVSAVHRIGEPIGVLQSRRGEEVIDALVSAGEFNSDFGDRVRLLLRRGFSMATAVEAWHRAGIKVTCKFDEGYPIHLLDRLGEQAPPVIYSYGQIATLDEGWLAIQGSRNASDAELEFASEVGASVAEYGKVVVSGGARGIDRAGMSGALNAGGSAVGVLVESLTKHARSFETRSFIESGDLTLFTPYDPDARFTVGNAMARNKLIFALAQHSLIAAAEIGRGGTWAGATEELKRRSSGKSATPIYVPTEREEPWASKLLDMGAFRWPGVASLIESDAIDGAASFDDNSDQSRSFPTEQLRLGEPAAGVPRLIPSL